MSACGYLYKREEKHVDEVIRYKSGKHKGEVKSIGEKIIEFEVGDEPFIRLKPKYEHSGYVYYDKYIYQREQIEVDLVACPKCGTVKMLNKVEIIYWREN